MKILLLANHLNPGGITTYTISLAQGLKKKGHLVKVASRGGEWRKRLEDSGIEHIYLDLHTKSELSPKMFWAKRKLLNILRDNRVDILHPQTRIARVLAQFIQKRLAIPFISSAHGFYTPRLGNQIFPCWGEGIIAISEAVGRELINKFKLDAQRIRVIYNGIDVERFNKTISELEKVKIKQSLGINLKKIIVSISRLSFIKGHIYLIRAMARISQIYPDVTCLIIGNGEAENILKKEVKKLNLENLLKFYPSVNDTDKILAVADIFVLPTTQEGLGLAILEAMASGIPVVATNIGGIPEIIRDGENGLLIPAQDASLLSESILRLLKDEALRTYLPRNAIQTIREKFSLERMVDETEGFYKEIVEKSIKR